MNRLLLICHSILTTLCYAGFANAEDLLAVPPQVLAAQEQRIAAIKRASESTISVFAAGKAGGGGSGVVITQIAGL